MVSAERPLPTCEISSGEVNDDEDDGEYLLQTPMLGACYGLFLRHFVIHPHVDNKLLVL